MFQNLDRVEQVREWYRRCSQSGNEIERDREAIIQMVSNGRRGEFKIFIFDLVEHRMKFEDEFEQITSTRGEIKKEKFR